MARAAAKPVKKPAVKRIDNFGLTPGQRLGEKFRIQAFLGSGLEGEVYRVTERGTGVCRAAKLFYPQQNRKNQAARDYAKKLDRLRDCPVVIQYHNADQFDVAGARVTCLLSEFVAGQPLSDFVREHPGKRLPAFKALHVIYPLVCGLEQIHARGEYHGDIHPWNVLVRPRGIFFDIKLLDFYNLGKSTAEHRREDIIDVVRLLYDMTGGRARYAKQPEAIKDICRGLRRDLIRRRFPSMTRLRRHLESVPELAAV